MHKPAAAKYRSRSRGTPVIVLAGAIGPGAEQCYRHGKSAFVSIIDQPYRLEDAIEHTRRLLQDSTESFMRVIAIVGGLPAGLVMHNLSTAQHRP
jgi:glycerate 2-kinase